MADYLTTLVTVIFVVIVVVDLIRHEHHASRDRQAWQALVRDDVHEYRESCEALAAALHAANHPEPAEPPLDLDPGPEPWHVPGSRQILVSGPTRLAKII